MSKDMFFYSNYCDHCKDIINIIIKKNIRKLFCFVCIDTQKFTIPACVKSVPTVITKQKQILVGNTIANYIEDLTTPSIASDQISPYLQTGGYSSSYTWLTENGYDNDGNIGLQNGTGINSYGMIGSEGQAISGQQQQITESKGLKFDDSAYESYINSRNEDEKHIKRSLIPRSV